MPKHVPGKHMLRYVPGKDVIRHVPGKHVHVRHMPEHVPRMCSSICLAGTCRGPCFSICLRKCPRTGFWNPNVYLAESCATSEYFPPCNKPVRGVAMIPVREEWLWQETVRW